MTPDRWLADRANPRIAGQLQGERTRRSHVLAAEEVAGEFAECRDLRSTLPPGHEIVLCVRVGFPRAKHTTSISPLYGASPDPDDAAIVLRALMRLPQASLQWRRSMHELADCCDDNSASAPMMPIPVGRFISATTAVSVVVRTIGDACDVLQRYVLPFDRILFGDAVESIDELVARGQLFVVMTCLRYLREVMPPRSILPASTDPAQAVLPEFPAGIGEVIRCAELEFHRITSFWIQLRQRDERVGAGRTCPITLDYLRLHRKAVMAAQREMCALIDHPRFGGYLCAGIEKSQPPAVRTACVRIATALRVRLSAEIVLPLPRTTSEMAPGSWQRLAPQRVSA